MAQSPKAIALRLSRGSAEVYLNNFFGNVARAARLMHKSIEYFRKDELLFEEAIRAYVIALVGALETFYRDLFVFLYEDKPELVSKILNSLRPKYTGTKNHGMLTRAEIAATVLSFQRLDEINGALTAFLEPSNYFDAISSYSVICCVPSRSDKPLRMRLPEDWQDQVHLLLADRHRYVHDRNCRCDTAPKFMARIEFTIMALAQLTRLLLFELSKESVPKDSIFAFLLVEDLIADDWEAETPTVDF